MSDPLKHFQIIGTDLLINGKSIVKDINDTSSAWKNGQWELAGEALGDIFKLSTVQYEKYPAQEWLQERKVFEKFEMIDPKDIASFAQAFLEAMGVAHVDFTALLECIYVADQAALVLDGVVQAIKQAIADRKIEDAIGALIGAVAFVQQLKQAIPVCESIT